MRLRPRPGSRDALARVGTLIDDMSDDEHVTHLPGEEPGAWDDALCRFEDVLLAAPFDRALPDLDELLARADVTRTFLRQDDRARKLLSEAVLARPFADPDDVRRSRAHVEMMVLEVEVLTQRLRDPDTPPSVATRADDRLHELRAQLEALRGEL